MYDCSKTTKITPEVRILAHHPTAEGFANLLELKEKELQKIVKDNGLDAKLKGNPGMRSTNWASVEDLNLKIRTKKQEPRTKTGTRSLAL